MATLDREAPHRHNAGAAVSRPSLEGPLYWPLKTFAAAIGLGERRVRAMLRFPQWRRAWGWPRCWNGVDFWFLASAAANPSSCSGLPAIEPPHALPGWCLRVEEVPDLEVFPQLE